MMNNLTEQIKKRIMDEPGLKEYICPSSEQYIDISNRIACILSPLN